MLYSFPVHQGKDLEVSVVEPLRPKKGRRCCTEIMCLEEFTYFSPLSGEGKGAMPFARKGNPAVRESVNSRSYFA